jgi:NADPH:quinone reductase-like Zn-dependent oxidoreductase
MNSALPTHTDGVVIAKSGEIKFGNTPLQPMTDNKVLLRVHSGILNPSDVFFLAGLYPAPKSRPNTCGFEGSGVVIAAGKNFTALLNKRVGFMSMHPKDQGSYGEYAVVEGNGCLPLPDHVSLEQGAGLFVNPYTALIFMMICRKDKVKTIVHTGAAGSLGKFLVRLCAKEGITLINIVRKPEQVEMLKALGADVVLNCSLPTFEKDMRKCFKTHKPAAFFDCVSGDLGTKIFCAMPQYSSTYVYGALDYKPYELPAGELIFRPKILTGFWMSIWVNENPGALPELNRLVLENTNAGDYSLTISNRFKPAQFQEAVEYYQANQSKGKVLLQTVGGPTPKL